jgi:hypothetical protein
MNREVYFKIERLNGEDVAIEEKTPVLLSGNVSVSAGDKHRRKCTFTLAEPLPDAWLFDRWRLYYGFSVSGVVVYESLGVFVPLDPTEEDKGTGKITTYSGVDKTQLLMDSIGIAPTQFTQDQSLKEVVALHLDAVDETHRNLKDLPYMLPTNYTFADYRDAEHTLNTFVSSFACDFYYDRNGIAVLEEMPTPKERPIAYTFQEGEASIHTDTKRKFQSSLYYNKVIVVGGNADTGIFRSILSDYSNDSVEVAYDQLVADSETVIFDGGGFKRVGQDFIVPEGVDNIRSIKLQLENPSADTECKIRILAYSTYTDFNNDLWYDPTLHRAYADLVVPFATGYLEYDFVFDTPFGVVPGESIFFVAVADAPGDKTGASCYTKWNTTSVDPNSQYYEIGYGGAGGSSAIAPATGELYFEATTFTPDEGARRITRYFKDDAAASQDQVDAQAVKYLDEGIRIPSTINIENVPLIDLEAKDIIVKDGVKYEVLSFNIPLDLSLQSIEAGVIQ